MMNRQPGTHAKKRAIMAMIASGDSAIVKETKNKDIFGFISCLHCRGAGIFLKGFYKERDEKRKMKQHEMHRK
jgi:hypothetical protein